MIAKLEGETEFTSFLKSRFYEIVIDEAQDLNREQYHIFTLLHHQCGVRLFFVGDQRQNIYKFTGGSITNLQESFPDKKIAQYALEESYRCPQKVLDFVNKFQFGDCENVTLKNTRANPRNGQVELTPHANEEDEALQVVTNILRLMEKKVSPNEISVLTPSIFNLQYIADQLNEHEISFEVFGGQQKLKPTISLFCEILDLVGSRKTYTLKKVADYFGVSLEDYKSDYKDTFSQLQRKAVEEEREVLVNLLNLVNSFHASMELSVSEMMHDVLDEFERLNEQSSKSKSDIIDLQEFIHQVEKNSIEDVQILKGLLNPTNLNFRHYFRHDVNLNCRHFQPGKAVTLSTIHSAKGREWDYVFLPGLCEGKMPHYSSRDINDDLKKFYVACTRVRNSLFLSYPLQYSVKGYGHRGQASRFLRPLIP